MMRQFGILASSSFAPSLRRAHLEGHRSIDLTPDLQQLRSRERSELITESEASLHGALLSPSDFVTHQSRLFQVHVHVHLPKVKLLDLKKRYPWGSRGLQAILMQNVESPIARRLEVYAGKSNDVHTDHEQRVIHDLLNAAERSLASLELEIMHAPAQSDFDGLLERRRKEEDRVTRFRIALSPHKKLPPEILAAIFVICVGAVELRAFELPVSWKLSHVCSRWREVAFGEHKLWNNVRVDFDEWSDSLRLAGMAADFLSRGGDSLTIQSVGEPSPHEPWEEFQNPLADLVLPHAERIENLSLCAPVHWFQSGLGETPLPLGALKTLELRFLHAQQSSLFPIVITEEPLAPFAAAPELQKVTLRGSHGWPSLSLGRLPLMWAQLTVLSLSHLSLSTHNALSLLRQCANLVKCTLVVKTPRPGPPYYPPAATDTHGHPTPEESVHLLQLTTLKLSFDYDPKDFLTPLFLPALKHFELMSGRRNGNPQEESWPQEEFLALIERSQCSIEWLFTLLDIPSPDLAPLLESVPSLARLILPNQQSPFPDVVLRRMSNWNLLPQLRHIVTYVVEPIAFAAMLEHRWPTAKTAYPCLEFVSIFCGRTPVDFEKVHERFMGLSRARASMVPVMRHSVDGSSLRGFSLVASEYDGIVL